MEYALYLLFARSLYTARTTKQIKKILQRALMWIGVYELLVFFVIKRIAFSSFTTFQHPSFCGGEIVSLRL